MTLQLKIYMITLSSVFRQLGIHLGKIYVVDFQIWADMKPIVDASPFQKHCVLHNLCFQTFLFEER